MVNFLAKNVRFFNLKFHHIWTNFYIFEIFLLFGSKTKASQFTQCNYIKDTFEFILNNLFLNILNVKINLHVASTLLVHQCISYKSILLTGFFKMIYWIINGLVFTCFLITYWLYMDCIYFIRLIQTRCSKCNTTSWFSYCRYP